ncbi:unnamed protein product [Chrysoparadoxa australica]
MHEILEDLQPVLKERPELVRVFEQLMEPERVIMFRVPWLDDKGDIQVCRGFRVQFNSALGKAKPPHLGGLRFHPTVNLSILKFLGFEQIFKNALTGLTMGGGKGGSDFDPKGASDAEIQRFCQSFMTELSRHIGATTDVPAGDIGVGGREIGYLYGQYKRLRNNYEGVLTGKHIPLGGSLMRTQATGYGTVYFANHAVRDAIGDGQGIGAANYSTCVVSGSGNVALHAAEKLLQLGAKPITLSDSSGYVVQESGFSQEQINAIKALKASGKARIHEYLSLPEAQGAGAQFVAKEKPWGIKCDLAFPCATQNELDGKHAEVLVANGCKGVFEGANMPCSPAAINAFLAAGLLYGPGKASNAGGVAVSGLEMAQNAAMRRWTATEVDDMLQVTSTFTVQALALAAL